MSSKNILFFVLLFLGTDLWAITQVEFTQKVLNKEKLLEVEQIGLNIKQIEVDGSRANYADWKVVISSDIAYGYHDLDRETSSNRQYIRKSKKHPKSVELSFDKRFLSNPGNFEFGVRKYKGQSMDNYYTKHEPKGSFQLQESEFKRYIEFDYPLLKHDSNAVSLKTYRRDIIDLKRQKLSFFESKEDLLLKQLLNYLTWVFYTQHLQIYQQSLQLLKTITSKNEKDKSLLDGYVYKLQHQQEEVQADLVSIREKIATILEADFKNQVPNFDLLQVVELPSKTEVKHQLIGYSRDLERIRLDMVLKDIDLAYYRNQNLVELDFSVGAQKAINDRNTKASVFDDSRVDYYASLQFSYPLNGNPSIKTNIKKSRLLQQKLQISFDNKRQDLLADIKELEALLVINFQSLNQQVLLIEKSSSLEKQSYDNHQTSMRDLISAYDDLLSIKKDNLSTLVDYQKNQLRYLALLDRLIRSPCQVPLSECGY